MVNRIHLGINISPEFFSTLFLACQLEMDRKLRIAAENGSAAAAAAAEAERRREAARLATDSAYLASKVHFYTLTQSTPSQPQGE